MGRGFAAVLVSAVLSVGASAAARRVDASSDSGFAVRANTVRALSTVHDDWSDHLASIGRLLGQEDDSGDIEKYAFSLHFKERRFHIHVFPPFTSPGLRARGLDGWYVLDRSGSKVLLRKIE